MPLRTLRQCEQAQGKADHSACISRAFRLHAGSRWSFGLLRLALADDEYWAVSRVQSSERFRILPQASFPTQRPEFGETMSVTPTIVEAAMVRSLLSALLRTDVDLEAFCIDHFPQVAGRFGANQDRVAKTNLLLQTVEHAELIGCLRRRFPREITRFLESGGAPAPGAARWTRRPHSSALVSAILVSLCGLGGGLWGIRLLLPERQPSTQRPVEAQPVSVDTPKGQLAEQQEPLGLSAARGTPPVVRWAESASLKANPETGHLARYAAPPASRGREDLRLSPHRHASDRRAVSTIVPFAAQASVLGSKVQKSSGRCASGMVPVDDDGANCCWPKQHWDVATQRCAGIPSCPSGYDLPPPHLPIAGLHERCLRKPDWHPARKFSLCECQDEGQSAYQCNLNDYAFTALSNLTVEEIKAVRESYRAKGTALCREHANKCRPEFETANGGTQCYCCMPD